MQKNHNIPKWVILATPKSIISAIYRIQWQYNETYTAHSIYDGIMIYLLRYLTITTIALSGLFFSTNLANANIVVSDAIVEMLGNKRLIKQIAVGNSNFTEDYDVQVHVEQVFNPSKPNEYSESTNALIVTPNQFKLDSRKQRTIRIIGKKRPETEEVYRIAFKPITPKLNGTTNAKDISGKVDFIASTSALVILNPKDAQVDVKWERDERGITFANTGNTNIILRQSHQCAVDVLCKIEGKRVWAGNKWRLNLPQQLIDNDIKLELHALGEIENIIIKHDDY